MALKGTPKSKTSKTITSAVIFIGIIGIGGIANLFWQLLARLNGFEGSIAHAVGSYIIYGVAVFVGVAIIFLVWPDAAPEVIAAKKARVKAVAAAGARTPKFEAALARDKAARDAFMAEDDAAYAIDRSASDDAHEKAGEAFNSDLARDMRARR